VAWAGCAVLDVDPDPRVAAWLRAVAAVGLDGQAGRPLPCLPDAAWPALLRAVDRHRLGGLLHAGAAGGLPLGLQRREQVRRRHAHAVAWQLALETFALDTAALLGSGGVRFVLLKGLAVADRYPDRSWRQFADLDVLVAPESYDAAHAALRSAGSTRRGASLGDAFDRRYGKSVTHRMAGGYEVDVHRTLVIGTFGQTVDLASVFANVATLDVRGTQLPRLGDAELAVHAAYTAVLSTPFRLQSLRDLVQVLATVDDAGAVVETARRWRAGVVLQSAVLAARSQLGPVVHPEVLAWAAGYRPSRRERRWLRPYLPGGGGTRAQAMAGWRAVGSVPGRLDYLRLVAVGGLRRRGSAFDG